MDGYKLMSFGKISSTQDLALDLIVRNEAFDKTVIVAESQTAGRGRYKRKWVSNTGNLYASFIYKISERDPKLSYAIAVAVAETMIHFGISPQIKWPNDVLIDGKKISGILIEYAGNFVIIGIGINVESCPTKNEYKTTKVNDYVNASVQDVLNILIKKINKWRDADFALVREYWMNMAMAINKTIKYQGKVAELIGLNESGALVLRCGEKYILTYGDEIFV